MNNNKFTLKSQGYTHKGIHLLVFFACVLMACNYDYNTSKYFLYADPSVTMAILRCLQMCGGMIAYQALGMIAERSKNLRTCRTEEDSTLILYPNLKQV